MKTEEWHNIFKHDLFPSMNSRVLKETKELESLRRALYSINEHWGSGLFTDGSTFEHFHNLTDEDLIALSENLGTQIVATDKLNDVCERIK